MLWPLMTDVATQFVMTAEVEPGRVDDLAAWVTAEWDLYPVQLSRPGHAYVWLEVYFQSEVEAEIAAKVMAGLEGVRGCGVRRCQAKDWLSFWRHHFHPMDLGSRLTICPVWDKDHLPKTGRTVILIDPGVSFGTGDHFTTRFCLEMVDRICTQQPPPRAMLDAGTGSGILAIAAVKLGCPRALGLDNDPLALKQAAENLELNGVAGRVELRVQDVMTDPVRETYDLVCANILASVLIELAPSLAAAASRTLVLSGIREMEADGVAEAYMRCGFQEVARDGDGEWAGILMER